MSSECWPGRSVDMFACSDVRQWWWRLLCSLMTDWCTGVRVDRPLFPARNLSRDTVQSNINFKNCPVSNQINTWIMCRLVGSWLSNRCPVGVDQAVMLPSMLYGSYGDWVLRHTTRARARTRGQLRVFSVNPQFPCGIRLCLVWQELLTLPNFKTGTCKLQPQHVNVRLIKHVCSGMVVLIVFEAC
jgi:hypothetical protein